MGSLTVDLDVEGNPESTGLRARARRREIRPSCPTGHSEEPLAPKTASSPCTPLPTSRESWALRNSRTHNYNRSDGPGKAPDEGVSKGQPAEVGVSVALGVQAHRESWTAGEEVRATRGRGPSRGARGHGMGIPSPAHTLHVQTTHTYVHAT